jgi:hypothetical protein
LSPAVSGVEVFVNCVGVPIQTVSALNEGIGGGPGAFGTVIETVSAQKVPVTGVTITVYVPALSTFTDWVLEAPTIPPAGPVHEYEIPPEGAVRVINFCPHNAGDEEIRPTGLQEAST